MADRYRLKIQITKDSEAVLGTGYHSDDIVSPAKRVVLLNAKSELDTLEATLTMVEQLMLAVKEE